MLPLWPLLSAPTSVLNLKIPGTRKATFSSLGKDQVCLDNPSRAPKSCDLSITPHISWLCEFALVI